MLTITLLLHGSFRMFHCIPGAGDVEEDGICNPRHSEPILAHILVPDSDQMSHTMLAKLLGHLLCPLLVELHGVEVTRWGNGAEESMGEGATTCTWKTTDSTRTESNTGCLNTLRCIYILTPKASFK